MDRSSSDRIHLGAQPAVRGPLWLGLSIVGLFFGLLLGWAGHAPLHSAALAPGFLNVDSQRKTVKHLEGGIVRSIRVRDGDRVQSGQLLIRLDDTRARARLGLLRGRLLAALALEARLLAERDGRKGIDFPPNLSKRRTDPRSEKLAEAQVRIFKARRESLIAQTSILKQRLVRYAVEIRGLKEQITSGDTQMGLLTEEIAVVEKMLKRGLALRPRYSALRRRHAELEGRRRLLTSKVALARENISETRLRIAELRTGWMKQVVSQIREVETTIFSLVEEIRTARDVLGRTAIRAPRAGTVVALRVHSPGAVVGPGETLLEIVPSGDRLVIEARIDPNDIDVVKKGQAAQVRLTPYNQRRSPPLAGRVVSISADRIIDARTGRSHYLARVALAEKPRSAWRGVVLYPGMPAEVMIDTGARTALEYLTGPITRSFDRAFREQ